MAQLGDVLRGLGSVLNPQVAEELAGEDKMKMQLGNQVGLLLLQNQMAANTPEGRLKLEQLRNDMAFREAAKGIAPGDYAALATAAAKFGKPDLAANLFKAQEDRAARLQIAADSLEQKKQQAQMMHEMALTRLTNADDRLAETKRHNAVQEQLTAQHQQLMALFQQSMTELKRQGLDLQKLGLNLQLTKFDEMQRERVDRDTQQFANKLEQNKVPQVATSIKRVNDLLSPYIAVDEKNPIAPYRVKEDIPGLGYLSTAPGATYVLSEKGKQIRSAVQGIANDLLNMYSGLAVTVPEEQRRTLEMMSSGRFNEQDFLNAWPKTVDFYNAVIGNFKAGYGPRVLQNYSGRAGALNLDVMTPFNKAAPRSTGAPTAPAASGATTNTVDFSQLPKRK